MTELMTSLIFALICNQLICLMLLAIIFDYFSESKQSTGEQQA